MKKNFYVSVTLFLLASVISFAQDGDKPGLTISGSVDTYWKYDLSGYTDEGVKTVLPAKAMAKMDFRLVPNQDPNDILEKLKAHLKTQGFEDVQVKKLGEAQPVVTPIEGDFVQSMIKICKNFTNQEPEINALVGGTLPLLGPMKKNVGVLGISTSGNPSYYGSGPHAPNEHIRLSDIQRAIEFNVFMISF